MRLLTGFFLTISFLLSISCGSSAPATPIDTFKAYTKAISRKDTTEMKILLSDATIKMHEEEAKAQGLTLDDIVKRETLFRQDQRQVEFRNEKIEGEKATLEVKNSLNSWETVPFVKEDGVWKIDKKGFADQMMQQIDRQNNQQLDSIINQGRQP